MPRTPKELGKFIFYKYEINMKVQGPLHATSPSNERAVDFMLAQIPSDRDLKNRISVGEPIETMDALRQHVLAEVGVVRHISEDGPDPNAPEEPMPEVGMARFRRDKDNKPFLHPNFFKGHLRDAGDALSRPMSFWGLRSFINMTLFIAPQRVYLPGEIGEDTWPTHFDSYRRGRISAFRKAEFVESPALSFRAYLVNDQRWSVDLLDALLGWGAMRGIGGGRGRAMGQYEYTMVPQGSVDPKTAWADR